MNSKRASIWVAALALLAALGPFAWKYDLTIVVGESMQPTFSTTDLLLIDTQAYRDSNPQRGDILVARRGPDLIVKRVVGLPSEEVEIQAGRLMVDGETLPEPYLEHTGALWIGPGRLGQGRYAVVGDNRNLMVDQAVHGIVGKSDIVGKVRWAVSFSFLTRMLNPHA